VKLLSIGLLSALFSPLFAKTIPDAILYAPSSLEDSPAPKHPLFEPQHNDTNSTPAFVKTHWLSYSQKIGVGIDENRRESLLSTVETERRFSFLQHSLAYAFHDEALGNGALMARLNYAADVDLGVAIGWHQRYTFFFLKPYMDALFGIGKTYENYHFTASFESGIVMGWENISTFVGIGIDAKGLYYEENRDSSLLHTMQTYGALTIGARYGIGINF